MNRRRFLWGTAALAAGAATAGVTYTAAASEAAAPQIVVDASKLKTAVAAGITGVNGAKWYDNGFGIYDPAKDAVLPDFVAKVKRAGIGLLRYPGGTSANLFRWERAVGPQAGRTNQVNGLETANPEDSRFGPDEWMPFLRQVGAELSIVASFAAATPQEIANWVQYMNGPQGTKYGDLRAKNGHPEPYGVRYWEIGNEHYVGKERYWMSPDMETALKQYAFGGVQRQENQAVGRFDDHRPAAGVSTGKAGQSFTVHYPPVVPDSQVIKVDGEVWKKVADLSTAGAGNVYGFNAKTGILRFGDGTHGAVPKKGAKITADYDSGPHAGFVDFYAAMKAVDPAIKVISCWAPVKQGKPAGGKTFPQLMAERGHADKYDGLAVHPYTSVSRDIGISKFPTRVAGHHAQMIGDRASRDAVVAYQADVKKYGKASAFVTVSESGALFFGDGHDASAYPQWTFAMSHALYEASQWSRFLNHGLPWAVANDLVADHPGTGRSLFGGTPGFLTSADAVVREQLKPVVRGGGHVVDVNVADNVQVNTNLNTPVGDSYWALITTATVDKNGALNVVVVNRSPTTAIKSTVKINGFTPAGEVAVSVVSGAAYDSFNSAEHPDDVQIKRSTAAVTAKTLTRTFAAHSVTVLRFPK